MSQLPPPPPQPTHPSRPARQSAQELPATGGPATQVLPRPGVEAPDEEPTPISAPLPPPPGTEPTGPVDFVPAPPPSGTSRVSRRPRDRGALAGLGLAVAAVLLLEAGLLLDFGGAHSFWTTVPLW